MADNEISALKYGIFNLGFIAVRNDEEGNRFARWWDGLLYQACYDEPERGIFTDQKYCDLVPAFFNHVHILQDPGCNVASWNLSRRRLHIERSGEIRVNAVTTLKFYHFTKINSAGDIMTERYAGDSLATYEIWEWYRREITKLELTPPPVWSYGHFADSRPIPREARLLFRRRPDVFKQFLDPFSVGPHSFREWWKQEVETEGVPS